MNSENSKNTYKLRDHPAFPVEISVPFCKELRPELICSTCNCITPAGLKDRKGHVFCRKCASVLTDDTDQFTCYICDSSVPVSSLEKNNQEWALLEDLPSACPDGNKGCDFGGKLGQVLKHYERCGMKGKVRCVLCGGVYGKKVVADHMLNDCPERWLECTFCGCDIVASEKKEHEANCDQRPGTCKYCDMQFKTYQELVEKHEPLCQLKPVDCSFKQLGCTFKAARREMEVHEGNSRDNRHSDLLVRKICHLERENQDLRRASQELLKTVTEKYEEKMRLMEGKMVELLKSANAEQTLRADMERELSKLRKELQKVERDNQRSELDLRARFQDLEQRNAFFEEPMAKLLAEMATIK
ncbi:hypothetical protein MTO96_012362 [Rhipicephalus appendiculatus]